MTKRAGVVCMTKRVGVVCMTKRADVVCMTKGHYRMSNKPSRALLCDQQKKNG